MKKLSKPFVTLALCILTVLGIYFCISFYLKSDNKFPVKEFKAVESVVGSDGRSAVGSPEVIQIGASPSYTWRKGDGGVKTFRIIGVVLLIGAAVYGGISELQYIKGNIHIAYVILVIAFGCFIGAYSSAFVSNFIEVSRSVYESIKNDNAAIERLFDAKNWIK